MKHIIIGLLAFLLLVWGLIYLATSEDPQPTTHTSHTPVDTSTTTPTDDRQSIQRTVPEGSYLHAEPDRQYTIILPHSVDVSSPQAGIARYRYVGPESEAHTEITDGYTITIEAHMTNATSLETAVAHATQGRREAIQGETSRVQRADQTALRYITESALSGRAITNYTFLPDNGYAYTVRINISSASDTEYETVINEIVDSLRFVGEATAQDLESRIIPIAMLDYAASGDRYVRESTGPTRGCDSVVLIEHIHDTNTITPLNASLTQLFAYERGTVAGWQNFIASQHDTLSFERAEIVAGEARIYLTGQLGTLGGVCDNPRAAIQIEETALAYDTVDTVQIYLNGEPTDLTPDGR